MAGSNTTGLPNTNDYVLGRGVLYASLIGTNGKPIAWRDLGNAPSFSSSVESESLDHQSSRTGLKFTDKSVLLSQSQNISFELDEINHENLALFFSGSQATHTNPAKNAVAEYEWIVGNETNTTDLQKNRWYDLVTSGGERLYDVTPANITLKTTAGSPVTLVENTDYTVDATMGRIFIKDSAAITTAIAAWQGIRFAYVATPASRNLDEVRALTQSSVQVALKFIGENPANNNIKTEYQFHKVTLKAEGDFGLISDEFTKMGFTAVAESNPLADIDSPVLTIRDFAD